MTDPKTQIHAELMAMRADGAGNPELILAGCTKLFAAGMIPNQANVLEVVRSESERKSPSMPTIRKGIADFWKIIRTKVGEVPEMAAEGVPPPIVEVLQEVAPRLAVVAEELGRAWYQERVSALEAATQTAIDAAAGFEQAAKDSHARLDQLSAELARERQQVEDLLHENASNRAEIGRQADQLRQADEQARNAQERIERLEADGKAARIEAAQSKDAHRQATKELATMRETVAALRAQVSELNTSMEQQAEAHGKAIDDLKTAHAGQIGALGQDLAKARADLKESESEKQALLAKNGELAGEIRVQEKAIKTQESEVQRLTAELRAAQNETIEERARRVNSFADAGRVVEWIRSGQDRKRAVNAFTEGPERQIAYAVEDVLLAERATPKEGAHEHPDAQ